MPVWLHAKRRDLLDATEDSFDELIATNLKGPYFLTQAVARHMNEKASGRIVFVTSISAYTASVNRGEYCVSKAGPGNGRSALGDPHGRHRCEGI